MMVEAHKLAKEMEGDYQARLSLALRQLWKKKKGGDRMRSKKSIVKGVERVLKGVNSKKTFTCSRWQKHGKDRLYINRSNGNNKKSVGYIDLDNPSTEHVEEQTRMINFKFEEVLVSELEKVL